VQRATHLAFKAAEKSGPTYTLGPIIHSPQVVQKLEDMGVRVLQDLQGVREGTIIIRSHGVTAAELADAVQRELEIVDATCPFVKKAQEHVRRLSAEGYVVVVVGDAEHPEVQGIVSFATGQVFVARSGADVAHLPKMAKVGVVAQTTQSYEHLESVVCECLKKAGELRVFHTICDATAVRQTEAVELARQVDCMIVIGGYNSANTCRLAEVCSLLQPQTHHIERADQIEATWFAGVTKVGVTAGASTPKWLIDEVIERIQSMEVTK
jgi:4-hydroxy-3-methylbut-2-enyl diphosphate reductase